MRDRWFESISLQRGVCCELVQESERRREPPQ
jgi:hypothetical protein